MEIIVKDYVISKNLRKISLEDLYNSSEIALSDLAYDIKTIVETEAPITFNILKERLRQCLNIGKISQKALDVIMPIFNQFNFVLTDNLLDKTIWPSSGVFDIEYVRMGYTRQIYDVPLEEIRNVVSYYSKMSENDNDLYHSVLTFFGYQVLTQKASNYLNFVKSNL